MEVEADSPAILGTRKSVLISGVATFQGSQCMAYCGGSYVSGVLIRGSSLGVEPCICEKMKEEVGESLWGVAFLAVCRGSFPTGILENRK